MLKLNKIFNIGWLIIFSVFLVLDILAGNIWGIILCVFVLAYTLYSMVYFRENPITIDFKMTSGNYKEEE